MCSYVPKVLHKLNMDDMDDMDDIDNKIHILILLL
mgnify:CR=1 FL=1